MPRDQKPDIESLKFHWEKWRGEADRFWRHAVITTLTLVAISMFQLDVIQLDLPHVKLIAGPNTQLVKRWLICPVSVWLFIAILFELVDLTRHRVREEHEPVIHNNRYPFPGLKHGFPLKPLGRSLYLISSSFFLLILAGWVSYCSWKVWHNP